MPGVKEGVFTYRFPPGWTARKFDADAFYKKHFQNHAGGSKGVDVLGFANADDADTLWLIEQKDYRQGVEREVLLEDLFEAVAHKASATLACLVAARSRAQDGSASEMLASAALLKRRVRCILHIEQPAHRSRLFPVVADPKTLRDRFRRAVRAIDVRAEAGDKATLDTRGLPCVIA
jgi:hypothetical protein